MPTEVTKFESRIDPKVAGAIAVHQRGGVRPCTMAEVMEVSRTMAIAKQGVPKHLRDEPGLCFSVVMQAMTWEMDVFSVARMSFVVNDQLAYMSQLIHAVIEARAPLKGRLRCTYAGEGHERTCTVLGTFDGETDPHTYTTPKFKDIPVKNSPLWRNDPDQQSFYFASRSWARKWCPDVLMGIYEPDEIKYAGMGARDVTPVEDQVDNPLGGDDEPMVNIKVVDPDGNPVDEAPEKPADTPKPKRAAKPRAAKENTPAATPDAGQGIEAKVAVDGPAETGGAAHPNTVAYPAKEDFIRWAGPDYVAYLIQWCNVAAVFDGEGFLRETYIRDRHKKEMAIRNQLGTPLSAVERELVNDICRGACKGIEQEAPDGTED